MKNPFIAKADIVINASAAKVWDAITNPALIKQYLFGTEVVSDWKVGSPILYKGEWQGKSYEDKGTILQFEPEKVFASTYWSSMGGLSDVPENYNTVTYILAPKGDATEITLTQDNIATEASREHSEQNWKSVLEGLKKLVEA
jgi:uncharacterized protein YndB with AHSA1/START domain